MFNATKSVVAHHFFFLNVAKQAMKAEEKLTRQGRDWAWPGTNLGGQWVPERSSIQPRYESWTQGVQLSVYKRGLKIKHTHSTKQNNDRSRSQHLRV